MPHAWGGQDWSDLDVIRGYLRLSAACLTTTFILTQRTGACRRIVDCDNLTLQAELLPDLTAGRNFRHRGHFASHHQPPPSSQAGAGAEPTDTGFVLDGFSPWVTGGATHKRSSAARRSTMAGKF